MTTKIVDKINDRLNQPTEYGCAEFGYVEFSLVKTTALDKKHVLNEYQCEPLAGDWKHTHLRMDYLIKKVLEDDEGRNRFKETCDTFIRIGLPIIPVDHEYIDDTRSDWGTAYHFFYVVEEVA